MSKPEPPRMIYKEVLAAWLAAKARRPGLKPREFLRERYGI